MQISTRIMLVIVCGGLLISMAVSTVSMAYQPPPPTWRLRVCQTAARMVGALAAHL